MEKLILIYTQTLAHVNIMYLWTFFSVADKAANGDGGVDLIVQLLGCTVLIQCKNEYRAVGKVFVLEFYHYLLNKIYS